MNSIHDDVLALRQIDLDLLVCLDVLLRTGSVTGAAREIGLTQSAMSHALRRLRERFGDPLFVRVGSRMAPTPLAEGMAAPLRAALLELHRVVAAPGSFVAADSRRTFRVACPDLVELLLMPWITRHLEEAAPGVELVLQPVLQESRGGLLSSGDLDLAVVPVLAGRPLGRSGELVQRSLFRDTFSSFLREGHPLLAEGALSVESWAAQRHLLVSPAGRGPGLVDAALAEQGLARHVALRIPGFGTAPALVAATDLVLTAPSSLGRLCEPLGIAQRPVPVPLPEHGVALLWHRRFGSDPGHRWLREVFEQAAEAVVRPARAGA